MYYFNRYFSSNFFHRKTASRHRDCTDLKEKELFSLHLVACIQRIFIHFIKYFYLFSYILIVCYHYHVLNISFIQIHFHFKCTFNILSYFLCHTNSNGHECSNVVFCEKIYIYLCENGEVTP